MSFALVKPDVMNMKRLSLFNHPLASPIRTYRALHDQGIMGMNCRNLRYIARYNPRRLYPLVDNKLKTKTLAIEHNVNVPELLSVVREQPDIRTVQSVLNDLNGFCIKPAQGSGGKGILVALRAENQEEGQPVQWTRTNGKPLSRNEISRHLSNILAGIFSLGGRSDVAIVEELIQVDPLFQQFTHEGVPDLRVIVFKGLPVMAMMRLSCHDSHGKANLHQGAVGVGIDIAQGVAVNAVQHGQPITHHPDTQQPLIDLKIPHWQNLLRLACSCSDMTGLGYLGVDLVLDKHKGPLLLELNARPGLAIQVANNAGLLPRLQSIEALESIPASLDERLALLHHLY